MEPTSSRRSAPPPLDTGPLAAAARAGDGQALRRALDEARARLAPSAGPRASDPGSRARRTALVDAAVSLIWNARIAAPGLAVLAVGGYGRGELAPRSDVDLLVLRSDAAPLGAAEASVEPFVRALWDAGLEVGSAVRTLAQAEAALASDLHAATALLEGRFLAGERALFLEARAAVHERFLPANAARFLRAKIDETAERHARRGGTIFLLAPDLKEGRGLLRDLELARLLATLAPLVGIEAARVAPASPGDDRVLPALARADLALARWLDGAPASETGPLPERARALARAEALLAATRAVVHETDPTSKDRLSRALQETAAERFGYKDRAGRLGAENFLRDVFLAAKAIDRTLRLARERTLRALEPAARSPARTQRLGPWVSAQGSEVSLVAGALAGPERLRRAAELFLAAQRTKRTVSLEAREAVRRALSPESAEDQELERFREDREVAKAFRELLSGGTHVAATLRAMHDAGFLGELLPEFGALDGLAQGDTYHAYTVDEHTLAGIAALEGQPAAPDGGLVPASPAQPEREDRVREELFMGTRRRDLLRLGLLLHDAGKTGGALGHTERGVALVPDVARRLGLSLEEEGLVRFLVEHHLTLSSLVEKRDVDAPETRAALLDACDHDLERLDHLYLLTCADVRAVSPRAFTRWKDGLVTRLYEAARAQAASDEPHAPRPATPDEVLRDLLPHLPAGVSEKAVAAHLDLCPRAYLAEVSPDEVALHLELVRVLEGGRTLVARVLDEDGFERVYVATRDRPRLFAALCGGFAAEGRSIVAVSAYTRRDGVILDRFAVVPDSRPGDGGDQRERLERTLEDCVAGKLDPHALVLARARRLVAHEPEAPSARRPPVRVRVSNKIAPATTMIDVSAPDRLGLLHDLAQALSDLGLDIRLVKVATRGDLAVDVFYVSTGEGAKVTSRAALARLRRAVEAAAHG